MLGLFRKEKKVEKIDLLTLCEKLRRLHWDYEIKNNVIEIKGKYRNHMRTFDRVILQFEGGNVAFRDTFGRTITGIPKEVPQEKMFIFLKEILNVLD